MRVATLALILMLPLHALAHTVVSDLSDAEYALPDTLNLSRNMTNAWIDQQGVQQQAQILQHSTGANTNAIIQQRGGYNTADITQQYGANDLAIISQIGWGNDAQIIQQGSGNSAAISQNGSMNYAKIVQIGNNLAGVKVSQTGVGKAITVTVTPGYTR